MQEPVVGAAAGKEQRDLQRGSQTAAPAANIAEAPTGADFAVDLGGDGNMSPRNSNAAMALWRGARNHPQRLCLTDVRSGEERIALTYAELTDQVAAFAGFLREAGVGVGDRVALLMGNSVEFVVVFLGAVSSGAVVVPLNTRLNESELRHMLDDSQSRLLMTEDIQLKAFPGLLDIDWLRVESVTSHGPGFFSGPPLLAPVEVEPGQLLSLMYTSGTTGLPKAVMLTHESWVSVAEMATEALEIKREDSVLHVAPLTHGAGFLLLPILDAGGHSLLCRSYDPVSSKELIDSGEVTGIFLVPSMIRMLLDVLPDGWQVPESFRWLYYAGSPIGPETLYAAAAAFNCRLVQSFAQMESPMFLTLLDGADHRRALGEDEPHIALTAGKPLPRVDLSVVDPDGAVLPDGQDGEILARAPQMMAGYWGREADTAATLVNGWLHTGDIGHFDGDGYLHVVDRLKDMIVTGGSNVYAREVEDVLTAIPGVREAAVFGVPDRIWGEAVTAVLIPDGPSPGTEYVMAACRAELPGYRIPKRIYWATELPRNPYGKVLKRILRTYYERESTPM